MGGFVIKLLKQEGLSNYKIIVKYLSYGNNCIVESIGYVQNRGHASFVVLERDRLLYWLNKGARLSKKFMRII